MYLKKAAGCKVLFSKSITSIGVWSPPRFAFLFNSLFLFFLFFVTRLCAMMSDDGDED